MQRLAAAVRDFVSLRPLPSAAAALLSGIAAGFAVPEASEAWGVAAVLCALCVAAGIGWNLRFLALPAVFLCGAAIAMRADCMLYDVQDALSRPTGRGAPEFEFTALEDARPDPRSRADGLQAFEVPARAGVLEMTVHGTVGPDEALPRAGERWRCKGWLARPRAGRSRFSRRRFGAGRSRGANAVRVAEADPSSVSSILASFRAALSEKAGLGLDGDPDAAAMNRALLLGERSMLPYAKRKTFIDAGTVHVFAISGMHVMLMAGIMGLLLRVCGMRPASRAAVLIPAVFAYAALAGARPSALRAATMCALYLAAPALGRRPDALTALSATAIIVYGARPQMMFDAGCTLSFAVMAGITAWCAWARRIPPPWRRLDALVQNLRRDGRPAAAFCASMLRRALAGVSGLAGVSVAAWVAGVPPAAAIFGRITPGALVSGVPVCLLAGLAVQTGAAGIAAGFVWEPLGALLNKAAALCTRAMAGVSEAVASLPFSSFELENWGIAECAVWYAGAAAVACAVHFAFFRRKTGLEWLED